jgi:uncharacterized protein YcbK (DUF882 family)
MGDLSVHFSRNEFQCHCCGGFLLDPRLLDALEKLQTLAAAPVVILCGYRCPRHNQKVAGAPNSQHLFGRAADVKIAGLGLQAMYDLARQVPEFCAGGIGVYDRGFMHVDVRGHQARWAQLAGRYVEACELINDTSLSATPTGTQVG